MSLFRSIVMVDDNRDDNLINASFLKLGGWSADVSCYEDPRRALEVLCKARLPELLFVDVNMPGLTGFEFLGALSKEVSLAGCHVVLVTSSLHPRDRERADALGVVTGTVEKPLTLDRLSALARTLGL